MVKWLADRFVKRDYVRLVVDGGWCVMAPVDACDIIKDSDNPRQYTIEPRRMTTRQFELLHEFGGY